MFDLHPSHYLSIYKDVFFVCLITMSQIMLLKFLPYLPCFSYGACVHAKSLQSCPTLCDPMGCSSLGCPWDSPVKNTEGIAMYSSRRSSRPRDRTQVSFITGRFFTIWATKEAPFLLYHKTKAKLWVSFLTPLFPTHLLSKSSASPVSSILIDIP